MEPHQELNLTPYLDILMNLIVFVMLSGVAAYGEIPLHDEVHCADCDASGQVHRLHLSRDSVELDGQVVAADGLRARLATLGPHSRQLTVSAEPNVTLDEVVQALDTARAEHFDDVALAPKQ
jgi:biopolymer transport protein ExbD